MQNFAQVEAGTKTRAVSATRAGFGNHETLRQAERVAIARAVKELIAEGKIREPEKVIGKDGAQSPSILQRFIDDAESSPTVGDSSNGDKNEVYQIPVLSQRLG